jgi:NAD(P)H dehydrogenase (quinone)
MEMNTSNALNQMILVIGATGTIGQALVKKLKADGATFKALVRDAQKGAALDCPYVVGDLDDHSSMDTALQGVTDVFLNSTPGFAMVRQQTGAIDAAIGAGVTRVVSISSPGADSKSPSFLGRSHGEVDDYLKASGLAWVILQPSAFMQNFFQYAATIKAEGKFYGAYGDGKIGFIDVADIAAVASVVLQRPAFGGQSIVITGDALLSHADVADLLTQQLGKPMAYVNMPVDVIVERMTADGLPEQFARELGAMMQGMAGGSAAFKNDKVLEITGQPPRSFSQFITDNIAAYS